jgi:HD-GYP domain-containing protein (c-di-GMP phosphodiesterase class II)
MSTASELFYPVPEPLRTTASGRVPEATSLLERGFGTRFSLMDIQNRQVLYQAPNQLALDWDTRFELCREVARRGTAEFLDDEDPLVVLALPLAVPGQDACVAVATFLTRAVRGQDDLRGPAGKLGIDAAAALEWASRQTAWEPNTLKRVGELALAEWNAKLRITRLEEETQKLSTHLATTYEEISLLHRLTHNLRISKSDEDLGRIALQWLQEVLPAESVAIRFLPLGKAGEQLTLQTRTSPVLLTAGAPLDAQRLVALFQHVEQTAGHQPLVVNPPVTERSDWAFPEVRQLIGVPLAESDNLFGWLVALNHIDGGQFGTVEASLLGSVGAILGIHSGNIELYRQQSELLAGVVRALTSAIDAKDPYTRGHSDRVARLAVRLAQEMGYDPKTFNTIYLSGLLHDIGKIGINDAVLRKPGKLSESEYEHIKQHVEIGHRILVDLKKLDDVLPVVLHHHESWDGQGYPGRLANADIPQQARIVAVADAYDAMGSDRPYRNGMPDEKIDEIFRAGAGKQWDPEVVEAFFRARHDLREIVTRPSDELQDALVSASEAVS